MGHRLSIDVTKLLDNLEDGFLDVQEAMLILSALSMAAGRIHEDVPPGLSIEEGRRWLIQKALALVGVTADRSPQTAGHGTQLPPEGNAADLQEETDSQDEVEGDEETDSQDDDESKLIHRAVDDATMTLWGLGTVPLILVFSTDERTELGDTPFEHLKVLLGSALAGDRNAVEAASALAQRLAEGAQMRSWFEPPDYRIAREVFGVPEDE